MNYTDLSPVQKRVVDAYITLRPELANANSITRPEVEDLHAKLLAARQTGGEKIGYPQWLVKGEKLGRGSYVFPAPNVTNEDIVSVVAKRVTPPTQADDEFIAELREAGVEV